MKILESQKFLLVFRVRGGSVPLTLMLLEGPLPLNLNDLWLVVPSRGRFYHG